MTTPTEKCEMCGGLGKVSAHVFARGNSYKCDLCDAVSSSLCEHASILKPCSSCSPVEKKEDYTEMAAEVIGSSLGVQGLLGLGSEASLALTKNVAQALATIRQETWDAIKTGSNAPTSEQDWDKK